MSYITAVSYHWPQTSAVDKTNAGMEWEASSNVPRGPQHHLEPSSNVCEASPSLWTWPGECLRAQWRERVGGQVLLPPPQTRQTTLGQMALNITAMSSSVSRSNKLTPEGGGSLCHKTDDTLCWTLNELQDLHCNHPHSRGPECHSFKKSKWTMFQILVYSCSGHMVAVTQKE